MGNKLDQFFDQTTEEILSADVQILLFVLIWSGILKEETSGKIRFYRAQAQKLYDKDPVFKDKVKKLITYQMILIPSWKVSAQHKELIDYMEKAKL